MADPVIPQSPFQAAPQSPFGDTPQTVEAQPADTTATPMRTATMALAKLNENQQQLATATDISQQFQNNLDLSTKLIESGQENTERLQSVNRQTIDKVQGLAAQAGKPIPGTGLVFDPVNMKNAQNSVAVDRANNIQQLAKSALEDEAVKSAEDYLRHDDWVGFKAAINRMDPDKNTSYGVIRDHMVKNLIVSNAIEKAQMDVNEEGFWHKVITGITSVPESIFLGSMFQQLGNVDDKTNGYEHSFWRFLNPSTDMGKQIMAVQGMNATQLADYMPKLIENIKGNSTTLGLTDPGRVEYLLNQFQTGLSKHDQLIGDAFNWADMAALIPFGTVARGAAIGTEVLTGIGARKVAAERVAAAAEAMSKSAPWEVTQRTAVVPQEIYDNILPTALNPSKRPSVLDSLAAKTPKTTKDSLMAGTAHVTPNLTVKPAAVSLSGQISDSMAFARALTESPEIQAISAPSRFTTQDEQLTSIKAAVAKVEARTSSKVADYEVVPTRVENGQTFNQLDVTINQPFATAEEAAGFLKSHGYSADVTNAVQRTIKEEVPAGTKVPEAPDGLPAGNGSVPPISPKVMAKIMGQDPAEIPDVLPPVEPAHAEVVQDASGQFFPKVRVDVRETGFYTNDLNPPKQSYVGRWIWSNSQTLDRKLFDKGTKAGQVQQRWLSMTKDLNKELRRLGPNERTYLREVAQKGENEMKWYNDVEFNTLVERATGKVPSDKMQEAYRQYKRVNDLEYIMRNAELRTQLATEGYEHVNFPAMTKNVEGFGIVDLEGKPSGRVFNASDNVHYKTGELGEERLKELRGQGYVLVRMKEPAALEDGTKIDNFLVRKSDLESNPIPSRVLNYQEGGHRLYADKYFVKQARSFKQPDSGEHMLDRPNVFVTASTKAEAEAWAQTMERARQGVMDGVLDAKSLDEKVFLGHKGFPTGEEFMNGVKDGTFTLDHPFESLFDRELPSAYQRSPNAAKFADEEGFGGYYRTNGRMYYSKKGDALKRVDGGLAPTLDPFKAQNQALYNVARMSSFQDFKTSAIHHWVNTYGDWLNKADAASPAEIFNGSTVRRGIDPSFANQIEGQRAAIKRILNFRSDFDMHYQNSLRKMHEWIVGESDNSLRQAVSKAPLYLLDKNPVNTLRGYAFDLKLGLLNPGQFFIQTSTMWSALALSPRAGLKGMGSVIPNIIFRIAKSNGVEENALDLMAKRGMYKAAGFDNPEEFKNYIRYLDRSGFFAFGESHLLVNTSGPASAYAIVDGLHSLRSSARFFFNEAETWNRLVGARIAYDEAVERFGKADYGNLEFDEHFRGRAENYAFNMSQTSQAAWQKGLLSVPTQFWAYNWRMFEALVGKDFTVAQKLRLGLVQLGLAGTAGLPLVGAFTDYLNHQNGTAPRLQASQDDPRGQPDAYEKNMATLQRGLFDRLIYEATGADVQVGQRMGTGDFFTQTAEKLMGFSEYGKTSFADIAGGATYSIMGEALGSAYAIVTKWMSAESGGNDVNLTQFEWQDLFKQISTVNNVAFKAWYAHAYGIYQSKKGQALISDLPSSDAPFLAMGFAPGDLRDREAHMAWEQNRKETVQDSADFINRLWEEGVRQPDKMDQNARAVEQFISLVPDQYRVEVLKKSHLERDPSDYSRLLRIRERQTSEDNFATQEEDTNN